jgi:hypothetical protein
MPALVVETGGPRPKDPGFMLIFPGVLDKQLKLSSFVK